MTKREIRDRINAMLAAGQRREAVFDTLAGKGMRDAALAWHIAAWSDPRLAAEHERKVGVLVGLMFLQAVLGFLLGFVIGRGIGPTAAWIFGVLVAALPLFFAWGFHTHRARAYNAYILLSLLQLGRQFVAADAFTLESLAGTAISAALLAYVWFVRSRLFPDFVFVSPRKVAGRYVFAEPAFSAD